MRLLTVEFYLFVYLLLVRLLCCVLVFGISGWLGLNYVYVLSVELACCMLFTMLCWLLLTCARLCLCLFALLFIVCVGFFVC